MPVAKPEILKPEVKKEEVPKPKSDEKIEQKAKETTQDDFSPMPKSKHNDGLDISDLWQRLLDSIQSTPARALLKQWANPIKISPEETVIAMKNEIFLNQVQSGAKYTSIVEAVDSLFSQSDSNVKVRMSQPAVKIKPKPQPKPKEEEPQPDMEEVEELKTEVQEKSENIPILKDHSDSVNMVVNLFDGKVIE